ncbi:TetR family transcriptional regulator [Tsukamurella pulmonis]|uniref:DNA-binding transcriptional regulator, AcrR family n=1 Tax=Tsukamurella pulmonis TaxID=47312 RepID=A0A1H1EJ02_9ACTN|nr:TetR/AcrR family transcriptional regulator [Tsukamurella pulmonis]KXO91924.1 TetR family transcriptional regulator [Tsukamurella pulmonis]SDQ88508.1 DNA-binding transcriptional regulator, AcrR family [Tsukamurella pulmonis]SUP20839.1 HTH-type transcriptional regulator RutR [Tsukamurella pulmonis]
MMSQDLNPRGSSARGPANSVDDEHILDAARDLMSTIGIRRTTMADVARAAQVSRATLYRRYPNVQALAVAVTTREFVAALSSVGLFDGATGRETIARTVVHVTSAARSHPLLRRIVELDPDFLMPYMLHRTGRTSRAQLEAITGGIAAGQADGSVRAGDPAELAAVVLQLAWSSAFTGPVFTESADLLDAQLFDLIDRYLQS